MKKEIALRNHKAVKANKSIQNTRFTMTPQQFDLLTCLIGKIKPHDPTDTLYEISIKEFCEATGKKIGSGTGDGYYYTSIKKDLQALADKSTYILMEDGKEHLFRWLDDVIIDRGNGVVQISFHKHARKFLFQLTRNFTSYPVGHLLALKTMAAKRLFEILYSYKNASPRTIALDELKRELNATHYDRIYDFKKHILDKAIEEINKYTDLTVSYKTKSIKGSKKIGYIEFTIEEIEFELEADIREMNRKIAFEYNHDEKLWEAELWENAKKKRREAEAASKTGRKDTPETEEQITIN